MKIIKNMLNNITDNIMKKISFLKYWLPALVVGVVWFAVQSCEDEIDLKNKDYSKWGTPGTAKPAPPASVDSVRFSSAVYQVSLGHSIALTATVYPENAANKALLWESDDTDVVTVDNGIVSGVSEGTVKITVTTVDGGKTHVCDVKVIIVPITSLTLNEVALLLEPADEFTLLPITTPPNATIQSIEWEVITIIPEPEDPEEEESEELVVVTIDENGVLTAVELGEAMIIVTVNGSFTAACKVSVVVDKDPPPPLPPLKGLSLNNAAVRLEWGRIQTFDLALTYMPSNAAINKVVWAIDDESAVTLTPGVAPALNTAALAAVANKGKATVTATVNDIIKATSTVEVFYVPINGITVSDGKKVEVGKDVDLSMKADPVDATILFASGTTNQRVTWTSGNPDIATVNATTGRVTGKAPGNVTITATAVGWDASAEAKTVDATATVTVTYVPLTSVKLNDGKPLIIEIGSSTSLGVTYEPKDATIKENKWESSDSEIVEVKDGKISALKLGEVVITVTSTDGNGDKKETTCDVMVIKRR